jgi:hypothetical protein
VVVTVVQNRTFLAMERLVVLVVAVVIKTVQAALELLIKVTLETHLLVDLLVIMAEAAVPVKLVEQMDWIMVDTQEVMVFHHQSLVLL